MKKMKQPMAMKEAPGLARRARGGAMTPPSPLSGAGNMSKKPYEGGKMPVDSHAAGKDKTSYRSR